MPVSRVSRSASAFIHATISTVPAAASCTTQGTSPLSSYLTSITTVRSRSGIVLSTFPGGPEPLLPVPRFTARMGKRENTQLVLRDGVDDANAQLLDQLLSDL